MTRAVLVVGGAGYVGAHTCKALSQAGYRPVVFDNFSTGHRDFVRWGPLVEADIADPGAVSDAIRRHDCVAVLHFAACAYVGESVVDPAKYYGNNVVGTLAVLNGMRAVGCNALVFSSTCAVYGQPDCVPISELTRPDPINPYGASKLMVERIISDFRSAYGLRAIALRYFNACGADPDGELGELRNPETHLIPRAMMALQGHIEDFEIFGADFDTPDGTAIRDYIHVADLADAHVAALSSLLSGSAGGVFNLGTGHGYSVMEVLRAIECEAGESLPSPKGPRRKGDPAVLVATASRAQAELGFNPKLSDIETIVRTAWGWHRRVHPRRNVMPLFR
jgi:UDP-glucose 4-epimerase/UDP-arabinose 4-epimerase